MWIISLPFIFALCLLLYFAFVCLSVIRSCVSFVLLRLFCYAFALAFFVPAAFSMLMLISAFF